jgi:hypothetical protein
VQEEADRAGYFAITQCLRKREQMIVVDPDQIIGQQQRCQCSGKRCIHSKVSHEVVAPEFGLRQRPLCGQTILWGLQPAEFDHWESG